MEAGGKVVRNPWIYDRRKDGGKVELDTSTYKIIDDEGKQTNLPGGGNPLWQDCEASGTVMS